MAIVDMDGVAGEVKEVSPDALDAELVKAISARLSTDRDFLP